MIQHFLRPLSLCWLKSPIDEDDSAFFFGVGDDREGLVVAGLEAPVDAVHDRILQRHDDDRGQNENHTENLENETYNYF
jgi:hypothetical protein